MADLPEPPRELFAPMGSAHECAPHALQPNAGAILSGAAKPAGTADLLAYQLGEHEFVWRTDSEPPPGRTIPTLDGQVIGSIGYQEIEPSRPFEEVSVGRITLWGEAVGLDVTGTTRTSGSLLRRATGRGGAQVRCYDLHWRGSQWVVALIDYPHGVGLWRTSAAAGLTGEPIVAHLGPGLRTKRKLSWTAEATLAEVLICLCVHHVARPSHLANSRTEVAKEKLGNLLG